MSRLILNQGDEILQSPKVVSSVSKMYSDMNVTTFKDLFDKNRKPELDKDILFRIRIFLIGIVPTNIRELT